MVRGYDSFIRISYGPSFKEVQRGLEGMQRVIERQKKCVEKARDDDASGPDGQEANVVPTMPPKRHEPSQSFTNENLDAHGWFERAKELVADDYFYQAASAFTEALQCCQEERAVELDFECDLLKGRTTRDWLNSL
eukprot:g21834.t1